MLSWWVPGCPGNCGRGSLDWRWLWSPDRSKMVARSKMVSEQTTWSTDLVTLKLYDFVKPLPSETRPVPVPVPGLGIPRGTVTKCLSSVRLCYTSNHNQTGQATVQPNAWIIPPPEKDQSSSGPQVSLPTWPEAVGRHHRGVWTPAWAESRVEYTSEVATIVNTFQYY